METNHFEVSGVKLFRWAWGKFVSANTHQWDYQYDNKWYALGTWLKDENRFAKANRSHIEQARITDLIAFIETYERLQ